MRHRSDERLIHGIAKWLVTLIGERGNPSPEASTPTELASSNCQDWSASNWGLIGAVAVRHPNPFNYGQGETLAAVRVTDAGIEAVRKGNEERRVQAQIEITLSGRADALYRDVVTRQHLAYFRDWYGVHEP